MNDIRHLSKMLSLEVGMRFVASVIGHDQAFDMAEAAWTWINGNNLSPHVVDQLLSSSCSIRCSEPMIESRNPADAEREGLCWVNNVELAADREIQLNYDARLSEVKSGLVAKLSEIMTSRGGLKCAKVFVHTILDLLDMYAGDVSEQIDAFINVQNVLTDAMTSVLMSWTRHPIFFNGRYRGEFEDALRNFVQNKVDVVRHRKASQFYAELKDFMTSMEGELDKTVTVFNGVNNELLCRKAILPLANNAILSRMASPRDVDECINNWTAEFIASLDGDDILEMSSWNVDEILDKIFEFASPRIENYLGMLEDKEKMEHKKNYGLSRCVSYVNWLHSVPKGQIAIARDFAIVLNDNGHQTLVGDNDNYRQLRSRDRIVTLAAAFSGYMALIETGRILTCGKAHEFDRSDYIERLSKVKDVVACEGHTLVLYENGTVESVDEYGSLWERVPQHNSIVQYWRNIKQAAVGYSNVMGLTGDGHVIYHRECQGVDAHFYDECRDVVQVDCFSCYYGNEYSAVLHRDGTVTSDTFSGVSGWRNIIQIAVGDGVAVGLKRDGTIEVEGGYNEFKDESDKFADWVNVVNVECKFRRIVGITEDGNILTSIL